MATVDKAFRIKNGLVVEGSSATVNGSNVLTEASTEFLQDTTAAMFTNGSQSGITFSYDDTLGVINASVSTTPTFADRITFEGTVPDDYELILLAPEPFSDTTVTLPSITTTLVGKDTTDTFTNKTFNTAATGNVLQINGNTVNSYTGSGSVVALSTSPSFSTGINLNGSVTGQTTLQASSSATGTITFPAVTGTVVTTGDTATVSNTMLANSSVTINGYSISLGGSATYSTDNINEGTTNKYFTDERAQDAIAAAIAAGTQTNITITYDDNAGSLSFNASGGVSSLTGTANEVEVSASTGAVTIGLPNDITIAGNITINGTPTLDTHAATKGYVDNAVAGLDWHSAVNLLAASNVALTGSSGTLIIDGHAALGDGDDGYRILLKGQSTSSDNGIYVYSDNGSTYSLTRSTDADAYSELIGAAVFVLEGTTYGSTAWVQSNHYLTSFSGQAWVQFSGSGTYVAGNGLTLTGNSFAIDTLITTDLNSVQTLTNKTLTSPTLSNPSVSGLYLTDNNIVIEGTPDTYETTLTFTNPTDDRTITFKDGSGTVAFTSDIESAVDAFGNAVTGSTGISIAYASTSNILTIGNTGVLDITGTANQVTASTSTGSVTLSLPQSIATTSSPTFAGITLGQITLADSLIGTATTSIADTSATVVDSWSSAAYRSGKYIVQMRNGNDIEVIEVLVTVDGNNNVYLTEYADVQSNVQLGTTDAESVGGIVRLLVTSTSGTTVKVYRTLIEA